MNRLFVGFSIVALAFVMVLGVGSLNNVQAEDCGFCGIRLPSLCGLSCNRAPEPAVARDTDQGICGLCGFHLPRICLPSPCDLFACGRTEPAVARDTDVAVVESKPPCGFCGIRLPRLHCFTCD